MSLLSSGPCSDVTHRQSDEGCVHCSAHYFPVVRPQPGAGAGHCCHVRGQAASLSLREGVRRPSCQGGEGAWMRGHGEGKAVWAVVANEELWQFMIPVQSPFLPFECACACV